jgi:flagellar biosynthesis protein FliR
MEIQLGYFPQIILLVLARVLSIVGTVPFFGAPSVSPPLRAVMGIMITLTILPVLPPEFAAAAHQIHNLPTLVLAMLNEILVGVSIGLICNMIVGASLLGGSLASRSSALMMARTLDPVSGASSPIMATLMQNVFVLFVLLSNGHLVIVKLLIQSFTTMTPALGWLNNDFYNIIIAAGSTMFEWGLKIALPILGVSLIINACLGLIARLAPDFNVLFLALPVRLGSGIIIFGMIIRFGHGMFEKLLQQMLIYCNQILCT